MTPAPKPKREQGVSRRVLDYFLEHPNTELTASRIAKEVGVLQAQVASAVANLRSRANVKIEIPMRSLYIYRPGGAEVKPAQSKRMFEEVGKTKTGDIILECENGTLYRAIEL